MEAALATITFAPAKILGIDDRVGSVEVGKDRTLPYSMATPLSTPRTALEQ